MAKILTFLDRTVKLEEGQSVIVGRVSARHDRAAAPDNFFFDNAVVSGEHATISLLNGAVYLVDNDSTHGTRIGPNSSTIKKQSKYWLSNKSELCFGVDIHSAYSGESTQIDNTQSKVFVGKLAGTLKIVDAPPSPPRHSEDRLTEKTGKIEKGQVNKPVFHWKSKATCIVLDSQDESVAVKTAALAGTKQASILIEDDNSPSSDGETPCVVMETCTLEASKGENTAQALPRSLDHVMIQENRKADDEVCSTDTDASPSEYEFAQAREATYLPSMSAGLADVAVGPISSLNAAYTEGANQTCWDDTCYSEEESCVSDNDYTSMSDDGSDSEDEDVDLETILDLEDYATDEDEDFVPDVQELQNDIESKTTALEKAVMQAINSTCPGSLRFDSLSASIESLQTQIKQLSQALANKEHSQVDKEPVESVKMARTVGAVTQAELEKRTDDLQSSIRHFQNKVEGYQNNLTIAENERLDNLRIDMDAGSERIVCMIDDFESRLEDRLDELLEEKIEDISRRFGDSLDELQEEYVERACKKSSKKLVSLVEGKADEISDRFEDILEQFESRLEDKLDCVATSSDTEVHEVIDMTSDEDEDEDGDVMTDNEHGIDSPKAKALGSQSEAILGAVPCASTTSRKRSTPESGFDEVSQAKKRNSAVETTMRQTAVGMAIGIGLTIGGLAFLGAST